MIFWRKWTFALSIISLCCGLSLASEIQYDYLKETTIPSGIGLSRLENPAAVNWDRFSLDIFRCEKPGFNWQSNQFGISLPLFPFRTALNVNYDVFDNLNKTSVNNDSDGTFKVDSQFNHIKSGAILTVGDNLFSSELYCGVNSKFYYQKIIDKTAVGYGFDFGLVYKINPELFAGFSYNDIGGSSIVWGDQVKDTIPANYLYNLAYANDNFNINYIYSGLDNQSYIKSSLVIYNFITTSLTVPLNNIFESKAALNVKLNGLNIGYQVDFNELYGQNSQLSLSMTLGDIL